MGVTLCFVRHAKPDESVRDDATRPLTEEGLLAARGLVAWFDGKKVDAVISSPYARAVQTVEPLAASLAIPISTDCDLRERKNEVWHSGKEAYWNHIKALWDEHGFKRDGEESIAELRARNVAAVERIAKANPDRYVVIGTHGMALCSILNHYLGFGFAYFEKVVFRMPFIFELRLGNGAEPSWRERFFEGS
jgi:2,3-bisphosphoglycerate-dependent phosphoglycerate mutase